MSTHEQSETVQLLYKLNIRSLEDEDEDYDGDIYCNPETQAPIFADNLFKQMKREHEHFLAYKFELDEKENELNFTHKSPQEIFQQWEYQKEKARQKNECRPD